MTDTTGDNGDNDQSEEAQTQPEAAQDETPEPPLNVADLRQDEESVDRLAAGILSLDPNDPLLQMLDAWVVEVRPEEVVMNVDAEQSDQGTHTSMQISFRAHQQPQAAQKRTKKASRKPKHLRKRVKKALRRFLGRVRRILRR